MGSIKDIGKFGQSIWYDNINRKILSSGELNKMVEDDGLTGLTSNPSIFQKAIGESNLYDDKIKELSKEGLTPYEVYEKLAIEDIRQAADILFPVYERTKAVDGYVSLEVSPELAHDEESTIREAKALLSKVKRPNLMIKVPGTKECIPAIEELIVSGVNVNVTLLFSVPRYEEVARAYINGLRRRLEKSEPIDRIASVASFFVSRVDTAIDELLANMGRHELMGKSAIANAKLAYEKYGQLFKGREFQDLAAKGAKVQRLLWASTSTKSASYRDVLYVEELIGPDTVNTVPPKTLDHFRDHGLVQDRLAQGLEEAKEVLRLIEESSISLFEVTRQLEDDGVAAFSKAFTQLLEAVAKKL